jgi:hypothetical protein
MWLLLLQWRTVIRRLLPALVENYQEEEFNLNDFNAKRKTAKDYSNWGIITALQCVVYRCNNYAFMCTTTMIVIWYCRAEITSFFGASKEESDGICLLSYLKAQTSTKTFEKNHSKKANLGQYFFDKDLCFP